MDKVTQTQATRWQQSTQAYQAQAQATAARIVRQATQAVPASKPHEASAALTTPDCPLCLGRKAWNVYKVGDVTGFIKPVDEREFLARRPEAVQIGVQPCVCLAQPKVEQYGALGRLPKHRQHCTFDWFDALSDDSKLGKLLARDYAGIIAQGLPLQGADGTGRVGLALQGDTGLGKSGLAAAIFRDRLDAGVPCVWLDFNEFLDEVYKAQQRMFDRERGDDDGPSDPFRFVDMVATAPFLVIDDLGDVARFENGKATKPLTDFQRDKLYSVIRRRYEGELPSVITTNLNAEQLYAQFGKRVADRIGESWQWVSLSGVNFRFPQ